MNLALPNPNPILIPPLPALPFNSDDEASGEGLGLGLDWSARLEDCEDCLRWVSALTLTLTLTLAQSQP